MSVTGRRLDVVDVSDDPRAGEPQSVVVAFECTSCRQLLHVEFLVSPFESTQRSNDGLVCPRCDGPLRLRLPGPVHEVRLAD